jgi:hypothetical protein
VAVKKVVAYGPARSAIVEQVEAGHRDLVAMGSRSRGDIPSLLLGAHPFGIDASKFDTASGRLGPTAHRDAVQHAVVWYWSR